MPPIKFCSIWLTVWEEMFEEFQDGNHGCHLGYPNRKILALLISILLQRLPSSFGIIWLMVSEEMSFEEFQDGCHCDHLGNWIGTILAILNLYVTPRPPSEFWLSPTYGWGDVVWRISRWSPWWPSWRSEQNNFSKSESPCSYNASHQVSAQSDLWVWWRCKKCVKLTTDVSRSS